MPLFIECPTVIVGDGTVARDAVVVVEGDRIAGVEPRAQLAPAVARDGRTLSWTRGAVMPGLVDTHVHLTCTPGTNEEFDRGIAETSDEILFARAVRNLEDALAGGVTTIRDCGSKRLLDVGLKEALRRGVLDGPRTLLCAGLITTTGGHMSYWGIEADSADELRKAVRTCAKAGADFIKIMATGGYPRQGGNNPFHAQYTQDELRAAVVEAERIGLPVATHCLPTAGIDAAVDAGVHTMEHALFLSEAGFDYDPRVADKIAARGTPVSNAIVGWHRRLHSNPQRMTDAERDHARAMHRDRVAHLRDMRARGVRFVGGTDAGMPLTPFSDTALILALTVQDLGYSPLEALTTCTSLAAEAVGLGTRVGTLSAGKLADVVLVEGDPTADIRAVRDVRLVLVGGRPVWPRPADAAVAALLG